LNAIQPPPLDPKLFYRRIEALLEGAPGNLPPRARATLLASRFLEHFADVFGVRTVQVYDLVDGAFVKTEERGEPGPSIADVVARVAPTLPTIPDAEHPTWTGLTALGVTALSPVGDSRTSAFAVGLGAPPADVDVDAWLRQVSTGITWLEIAFAQHVSRRQVEGVVEQARAIQMSLLPAAPPGFDGYDLAAMTVPAESVGGDVFDWVPLDPDTLALMVADASGHGLPAALQARDVVTGLRMGIERDYKINRTVEKLNRVIHRSGLTSRFVSLVTGELETNGNFVYINAGHPSPVLLDDHGLRELTVGGGVLGPFPEATFKLGFAHVDRGAVLALFSDGVLEQGMEKGEAFGEERLRAWLADWREGPCADAVADLVARVSAHAGGAPFEDDVTVMLVRRSR
jgi:sigma-B regulation protein RsbU (phosphoserine phosphatase)